MFKDLGRRLGGGLVAAILIAVAAGITLVAAAFGAYAGLKMVMNPAAASALTALIFAAVAGLIALLAPRLIAGTKTRPAAPSREHALARIDPALMKTLGEVGVTVAGVVANLALSHRLKRQEKARENKHHKRR